MDDDFKTVVPNALQAYRLRDFAQDASFALQCIAKSGDFNSHRRLLSPFLSLGTDDYDERNKSMREYNAFRSLAEHDSSHYLIHCDSTGQSNQLENANIRKVEWWTRLLRAPTENSPPSENSISRLQVSFYLFLFFIYLCYRLLHRLLQYLHNFPRSTRSYR